MATRTPILPTCLNVEVKRDHAHAVGQQADDLLGRTRAHGRHDHAGIPAPTRKAHVAVSLAKIDLEAFDDLARRLGHALDQLLHGFPVEQTDIEIELLRFEKIFGIGVQFHERLAQDRDAFRGDLGRRGVVQGHEEGRFSELDLQAVLLVDRI